MAINTKEATVGQDTQFVTVQGNAVDAGSVGAGATVAIVVDHSANVVFNLNVVPEVQVNAGSPVTNVTLAVGETHPDQFVVNVTNNSAAAGEIYFDYKRTGI